jgi:hypothetical protein
MFLIPKAFLSYFSHYLPISYFVSDNIFISGIMNIILLCPVVFMWVFMLGLDDTIMFILMPCQLYRSLGLHRGPLSKYDT